MEQSFFKRRKILKKTNSLDLHPVKLLGSEPREKDCLNILLPRFKSDLARKLFQPKWKDRFIRIKLDQFGSEVWNLMDGKISAGEIAGKLNETFPEALNEPTRTGERVSKFLSLLYQQKFITFTELQKE